ncbi:MAG: sigma-70 family RNA polymerase sigma factor [Planctomycetes bacterium]|jgi:RNA polymerase sigma factor (sigma-70 family)|nr:sigma-70 family RNA polymerase sigma factor [Planctomycetota bacterium]
MTASRADRLFRRFLDDDDATAFADLHDLLHDELLQTALRLAPDRASAEDLVQGTLLGALEAAGRFDRERPVTPWLFGILHNQARMMRWRARQRPDPTRCAWPEPRDPAELAADREFATAVANALQQLGPTYAPVVQLHLDRELPANAIAAQLQRPAGTVRTQVVRGLAMLRQLLPAGAATALLVRVSPGLSGPALRALLLERAGQAGAAASGVGAATVAPSTIGRGWLAAATAGLVLAVAVPWWFATSTAAGPVPPSAADRAVAAIDTGPAAAAASDLSRSDGNALAAERTALPTTATLTVTVNHGGRPVAGFPVKAVSVADWRFERHTRPTGPDGIAHFEGLPPGPWVISPRSEFGANEPRFITLTAGANALIAELREVHRCEGIVVDGDERPLADATVWLCDGDGQYTTGFGGMPWARTDAGGRFRLMTSAGCGASHLLATAPGYGASAAVAIHATDQQPLRLRLSANGSSIRGRVVTTDGQPAAGVIVRAAHAGQRGRLAAVGPDGTMHMTDDLGQCLEVRTDAAGAFHIDGFGAGRQVLVSAWSAAHARTDAMTVGGRELELRLQPGATVSGRVLDAAGKPVAGAEIGTELDSDQAPFHATVWTDAEGRYTLAGLTPGEQVAMVCRSEPSPDGRSGGAGNAATTLSLQPGRHHEWNPQLQAGDGIQGTLRSAAGAPLAGWRVTIQAMEELPGTSTFYTVTDRDGRFALRSVPAATWQIEPAFEYRCPTRFWLSWPPPAECNLVLSEAQVASTLQPPTEPEAATLGRIEVPADPSASVQFAACRDGDPLHCALLDWQHERGVFTASLPAGSYRLTAINWSPVAVGQQAASMPFVIQAGAVLKLTPELRAGVRRTFAIVEPSRLGAATAIAELFDARGTTVTRWLETRCLDQPFAASVMVAPGDYRLVITTGIGERGAITFRQPDLQPDPTVLDVLVLPQ